MRNHSQTLRHLEILLWLFTLERLGEDYDRWDLVFDQYKNNSLKAATRKQRASGSLYKFTEDTPLPKKMQETFLKNAENKN